MVRQTLRPESRSAMADGGRADAPSRGATTTSIHTRDDARATQSSAPPPAAMVGSSKYSRLGMASERKP
jgi:hypothetical protein